MCHHTRMLWACGHSSWLGVFRVCTTEFEFEKGFRAEGCSVMRAHCRATYRSDKLCEECLEERARTAGHFAAIRERIWLLRENLRARYPKHESESGSQAESASKAEGPRSEAVGAAQSTDSEDSLVAVEEPKPDSPVPEPEVESNQVVENGDGKKGTLEV